MLAFGAALSLLAGSCSHPSSSASHIPDPPASVPAKPDYTQSCSPSGADASVECAQVVLQSIDNARAKQRLKRGGGLAQQELDRVAERPEP